MLIFKSEFIDIMEVASVVFISKMKKESRYRSKDDLEYNIIGVRMKGKL